jgi:hypothetical protein
MPDAQSQSFYRITLSVLLVDDWLFAFVRTLQLSVRSIFYLFTFWSRLMPAYSLINPNQQKRRWSGPGIVSSSFTVFALALLGCEKVPTFKEITGQESKPVETSKSVPTDQSDGTVAPVKQPVAATPIPVENPQEVLATFSSTPTFQRSDKDLARLAGLPGVLESISEMDLMGASGISDVGIQHITKFPNIEHLNLTGTKVTPLGVPVVSSDWFSHKQSGARRTWMHCVAFRTCGKSISVSGQFRMKHSRFWRTAQS